LPFLKQPVATITGERDLEATLRFLESGLSRLGFAVERSEPDGVVVRCLSLCFNMVVCRCWSDKLLFEVTDTGIGNTTIGVYALPSLFRLGVRRGERVVRPGEVIAALQHLRHTQEGLGGVAQQ
jgi:hypothetical protein